MMLQYDRNPTKIVSALKQMGKRLKLTAKKKGKEYAISGDLRDLNMFMRYLNTKGIEPDVRLEDLQKEDMDKYYSDQSLGIGKPKFIIIRLCNLRKMHLRMSVGSGAVAGIGVGPDDEPQF